MASTIPYKAIGNVAIPQNRGKGATMVAEHTTFAAPAVDDVSTPPTSGFRPCAEDLGLDRWKRSTDYNAQPKDSAVFIKWMRLRQRSTKRVNLSKYAPGMACAVQRASSATLTSPTPLPTPLLVPVACPLRACVRRTPLGWCRCGVSPLVTPPL